MAFITLNSNFSVLAEKYPKSIMCYIIISWFTILKLGYKYFTVNVVTNFIVL